MTSDPNGNIFIGYRREFSLWQAYTIYLALKKIHDRNVYIDLEEESSGHWQDNLEKLITSSMHYLLVIDPLTFGKKKEGGDDILLWEIELALKTKRNFVHVWMNDFDWNKHNNVLDEDLVQTILKWPGRIISKHNILGDVEKINDAVLTKKEEITPEELSESDKKRILVETAGKTFENKPIEISPIAYPEYEIIKDSLLDFSHKINLIGQQSTEGITELVNNIKQPMIEFASNLTEITKPIVDTLSDSDYFNNTAQFVGYSHEQTQEWLANEYSPSLLRLASNEMKSPINFNSNSVTLDSNFDDETAS